MKETKDVPGRPLDSPPSPGPTQTVDEQRHWLDAEFSVLDLETTGLNPEQDQILSVGLLRIQNGAIDLTSAYSSLVRLEAADASNYRAESALVHGILKSELVDAPTLPKVLETLAVRISGTPVIAHMGLSFDRLFLDRAYRRHFGVPGPTCWLDTARLAAAFDDNRSVSVPPPRAHGQQRLALLLWRYGLPRGAEHDALGDALSAAQLFLVLAHKATQLGYTTVADLRKLST